MLEMNVTRRNQTIVEVPEEEQSSGGFGGIGLLGGTPDGDVETQTNADSTGSKGTTETASRADDGTVLSADDDGSQSARSSPSSTGGTSGRSAGNGIATPTPTSDGGSTTDNVSSPMDGGDDAEIVDAPAEPDPDPTDRYCGNCRHFEYVRSSSAWFRTAPATNGRWTTWTPASSGFRTSGSVGPFRFQIPSVWRPTSSPHWGTSKTIAAATASSTPVTSTVTIVAYRLLTGTPVGRSYSVESSG